MRRVRVASGCLAVGAVINVLVAWAFAVWASVGTAQVSARSVPGLGEFDDPPVTWRTPVPQGWPPPATVIAAERRGIAVQWGFSSMGEAKVIRTGWPWYSLRSACMSAKNGTGFQTTWLQSGIELPGRNVGLDFVTARELQGEDFAARMVTSKTSLAIPRRLPVEPLLGGTLANSAIWAAIAGGFWCLVFLLRRGIRIRAGQCPRCGYSLSGLSKSGICPECGAGRHVVLPATQ